ncbi:hypothetical protein Bhyg_12234 [Pseudolycoriella hygida]|uniref:Uncharacterized protein n=1 Tax=Pseudolycoriella hygida TaxID=35572 RepID=A0A9Q0MWZ1_9DIPT|nr:hypothetical protein Bhyg_12234 [Pseudolycoriella hygida]
MPLTSAERKQRYIAKLKADGKYDDFLKKKAHDERSRQYRLKISLEQLPKAQTEKTKRMNREYVRRKVAKCRARKKGNNSESQSIQQAKASTSAEENGPYKTKSAWTKAVGKMFNEEDARDMVNLSHPKSRPLIKKKGLNPEIIDAIKLFYERDDVSRISPNMRDCRSFPNPVTGTKEIKQIRFLMYKLSDVHKMFVKHSQSDENQASV